MEATAVTNFLILHQILLLLYLCSTRDMSYGNLGLIMAVAQVGGANIGSRFAISNGEKVVRPVLVIVSILLSVRILFG